MKSASLFTILLFTDTAFPHFGSDQNRHKVKQECQHQQDQYSAIEKRLRLFDIGRLRRHYIYMIPELHELVVNLMRQVGKIIGYPRKHDWRDIAGSAAYGQYGPGENSGH